MYTGVWLYCTYCTDMHISDKWSDVVWGCYCILFSGFCLPSVWLWRGRSYWKILFCEWWCCPLCCLRLYLQFLCQNREWSGWSESLIIPSALFQQCSVYIESMDECFVPMMLCAVFMTLWGAFLSAVWCSHIRQWCLWWQCSLLVLCRSWVRGQWFRLAFLMKQNLCWAFFTVAVVLRV